MATPNKTERESHLETCLGNLAFSAVQYLTTHKPSDLLDLESCIDEAGNLLDHKDAPYCYLYDLYAIYGNVRRKLNSSPMTYHECQTMKGKFNPRTQARIVLMDAKV